MILQSKKFIGIVAFIFLCGVVHAQSIEETMTRAHPSCRDVFVNAMSVLPKLYREHRFDSMYTAISIWKESCGSTAEIRITEILLSMEEQRFHVWQLDSNFMETLRYYNTVYATQRFYTYPGNTVQKQFFLFTSTWAKLLLENKTLDVNGQYLCRVLTGEIKDPEKEIRNNEIKYPDLSVLLKQQDEKERNGFRTNYAILAGVWVPTGNLSLLGIHPSVGGQLGFRDRHNELDFTLQFRFLKSADTYTVKRDGSYYERDAYFGGYLGLDYTYYFASTTSFDAGFIAGAGYDGFDITGSEYYNDYLRPLSIGSFNANGGIRMNFFLSKDFYLGLQGKYNWINYANPGGTNLNGDAFSFDLIIGFNSYHTSGYH